MNKKYLEFFLFIIGILLSCLMFKTLMIHSDNTQLMDKVMQIKQTGQWVHHGNAATKMGSIPGSFSTAVTAVPMMIWFSPYAACAVILLFHILSYFIFRRLGYKLFPETFNPLYLVIFYWLNPWRVEQSELYNPGYLFLFSALHIWALQQMSEKKSFLASLVLTLTLGFCFQVHFSVLILGFSFLYLFGTGFFSKELTQKIKVNYKGIFAGLVIVGLSLVPWLLQLLTQKQTAVQPTSDAYLGKNLILVYPVIKSIIYFFRMGSVYFGRHIFSEITFDWVTTEWLRLIAHYLFHGLKWLLASATLILSFRFFFSRFRNYKKEFKQRGFLDHYLMSLFVAVIAAAALSPVEFNHWHFILCLPAILFYLALNPASYFFKIWEKYRKKILFATTLIFIAWNIFAALGSRSHSFKNDYDRDFKQRYSVN